MKLLTKPILNLHGIISIDSYKKIVFFMFVCCYFLQVPFRELAPLISMFALLFIVFSHKEWVSLFKSSLFCIYCFYISFTMVIAVFNGCELGKIIRFAEILYLIPLFFSLDRNQADGFYGKVFVRVSFIKAIILFIIYGIVVISGSYLEIRMYSLSNGWGDIYSLDSIFGTRVQVQGNALLVFSAFIAWYKKDRLIYRISLLIAVLIAGNKAFFIGIFGFFLIFVYRWMFKCPKKYLLDIKMCFLIICITLCFPFLVSEIDSILRTKADYSNAIRKEQAEILLKGNIFWGNGIGKDITEKGVFRDYSNSNYYELQTLYIIHQIGVVGYILFLLLTFRLCIKNKNESLVYIYMIYLAYSFFNPYCFDTTHMIVGILICYVCTNKLKDKKGSVIGNCSFSNTILPS